MQLLTDTGNQIAKLVGGGMSAPDMSHTIAELGDGSMAGGIAQIVEFSTERGRVEGAVYGATGTTVLLSLIYFYITWRKNQTPEAVDGTVYIALKDGITDTEHERIEERSQETACHTSSVSAAVDETDI